MRHAPSIAGLLLIASTIIAADPWVAITTESEPALPSDEIQFIREGPGDRIWIGTAGGLATWRDGGFERFTPPDGKELSSPVWAVAGIPDRLAIGTGRGVTQVVDGRVEHYLEDSSVNPVVVFGDVGWWAIAKGSDETNTLVASDGKSWSPVESFAERKPADLFVASDGAVWVVIDGDGVIRVDPAKPDQQRHHLSGLNIQSLFEDDRGRIWAGRWGRGVVVQEPDGHWNELLTDEESAVIHIDQSSDGAMWFGTTAGGLWRLADGERSRHLVDDGPISLLETTDDGRVWVATQRVRGLRYFRDGEWVPSLDSPMPLRCLVETGSGLWAGGVLDGLHVLREGE